MHWYTVLLILFTDGSALAITYPTAKMCGDALLTEPDRAAERLDLMLVSAHCRQTDRPSAATIRPRARPDKGE